MNDRAHLRKQPIVRRFINKQNIRIGPVRHKTPPTRADDRAGLGASDGLQNGGHRRFGIADGHAAEADVNRGRARAKKGIELGRRLPAFAVLQPPVSRNLHIVGPVRTARKQFFAVGQQQGFTGKDRLPQIGRKSARRQPIRLANLVDDGTRQTPDQMITYLERQAI